MTEDLILQARRAWANSDRSPDCALRYLASALLVLGFSVFSAAHAQMQPVNTPSAPRSASTSEDAATRARRVSEARSPESAASAETRQSTDAETEEPTAT